MSAETAPGEVYCIECGEIIDEKAEICPACGVRQPIPTENGDAGGAGSGPNAASAAGAGAGAGDSPACGNCGERIDEGTLTCPHCGYSARTNMRKRGGLYALAGVAVSLTGVGLIVGVPILVYAMKRLKKATRVTAAYTTPDGDPYPGLGF